MLNYNQHVDRWLRVLFHYWPAAGVRVTKEVIRLRMIESRARDLPSCRRAKRSGVYCGCPRCRLQVALDMERPDFSTVDEHGREVEEEEPRA